MARRVPTPRPAEPWGGANVDTWRREVTDAAERVDGWTTTDPPNRDWVPDTNDQWIGDSDKMPRGVAVGKPTDNPDVPGVQGAVVERTGAQDGAGGLALVGYRDQDTRATITDPGMLANAPVEISGIPLLMMGGALFIETPQASANNYYLIAGETTTLPDGRHIAPIEIGDRYVPTLQESASDSTAVDLDDAGTLVPIVTIGPLANSYAAQFSTFAFEIRLSEQGPQGRTCDFDVEIWWDQGGGYQFVVREEYSLAGGAQNFSAQYVIENDVLAGQSVQLRASSVGTHPNADGWVRGDVRSTTIQLRQN